MEKLEDSQIKERAEYNVGHDLITLDVDMNFLFEFHVYKGRLFWVEGKQKIFVERFRTIPGELGGELIFTARYDETTPAKECICKIIDKALSDPVVKKTLEQYLKTSKKSEKTDESVDLFNKYPYLTQITEAATAKNVKTRDEEHNDKLVQSIIKSGSDFYILVDGTGTAGHYKAVQVYDGANNKYLVQKIPDLDLTSGRYEDGEAEFKEMVSKSGNKIFDPKGENSYDAIDAFKLECLTHFDSLNDKRPEDPVAKENHETESAASASNKGIDTTSDDIYGSSSIDDYPNIRNLGRYKNPDGTYMDIQFQFSISSLEISKSFGWSSTPIYDITPNMIKNTCLDYREAKKVNLYINGINKRPKDATVFIESILPYIHLEFKDIKKHKAIRGGKSTTPPPTGGTSTGNGSPTASSTTSPAASNTSGGTSMSGGAAPTP